MAVIKGGNSGDNLAGTALADVMFGYAGNDGLKGDAGDDALYGGAGSDTLNGGDGADLLDGGEGADALDGGAGNDTYVVDNAADKVIESANKGVDTVQSSVDHTLADNVENLTLAAPPGAVYSNDFDGHETLGAGALGSLSGFVNVTPVQGFSALGFSGAFLQNYSLGAPTTLTLSHLPAHTAVDINFLLALIDSWDSSNGGGGAPDYFNVSVDGTTVLQLTAANAAGSVTYGGAQLGGLANRGFNGGWLDRAFDMSPEGKLTVPHTASTLTIQFFASGTGWEAGLNESWGIEDLQVNLSTVAAPLHGTGNALNNVLVGNDADNALDGLAGDDTLKGGAGNDTLKGGDGNDSLDGGDGKDDMNGDAGNDTLAGGLGNDKLNGGDGNDSLDAGAGDDHLDGGTGDDILNAGDGNNTLLGGDGNDTLSSGVGDDILDGGNGNDRLDGGAGRDRLDGGAGDDTLTGGAGDDTLTGGAGNNTYVFTRGFGGDVVFSHAASGPNNDRLVFADIKSTDVVPSQAGNDAILKAGADQVRIANYFLPANDLDKPASIQFSDGKVWTTIPLNHAPAGADKTVGLLEDGGYALQAADFGFADPNDSPANNLKAVKIASLPAAGALKLDGAAVAAGDFVSAADIATGKLVFAPAADANGAPYASLTFQVQDDGGTANGGADLDPTPNKITFNVAPVNDAPAGTDKTIDLSEDQGYALQTADFGFTDPVDSPANSLLAVKIASLPAAGALTLGGSPLAAGAFVRAIDITRGELVFTPAADGNGAAYASFKFQVQDDASSPPPPTSGPAGAANGGTDLDPTPNTVTFNLAPVNDAPAGADKTLGVDLGTAYALQTADFGFSDAKDIPANGFKEVKIVSVSGTGSLALDGAAVAAGDAVDAALVGAGKLVFTPAAGADRASFTFQVRDDGGTANGGVDLDPSPNTFMLNMTAINDPPTGADKDIGLLEDGGYALNPGDFGFSDALDSPVNAFKAVKIASLPAQGSLALDGAAVAAGDVVDAGLIGAGKLVFTPAADANGMAYASLGFQVQDDGGTDGGGVDLDPAPNTLTFSVVPVNDAPAGADKTVGLLEDGGYALQAADFGFSDPKDGPADNFAAVKIASLPAAGTLQLAGAADLGAGQAVSKADIDAGKLVFTPLAAASGAAYAGFSFQVQDGGGTDNGGVDLAPAPNTITFNVAPVNDAPAGADKSINLLEDAGYALKAADFGFSDPGDSPANNFAAVKIPSLPAAGSLKLAGAAVAAGQVVGKADIDAGKLMFTPAANKSGAPYASLAFQVKDDGGGAGLDPTPNRIVFNVAPVNDAPAGADKTAAFNEDTTYVFKAADFGFSDLKDSPANNFTAVKIASLPGAGVLTLNGAPIPLNTPVGITDITAGKLQFTPEGNANGSSYAQFTFQARDNGGTANGGADLDPTPNKLTLKVLPVRDDLTLTGRDLVNDLLNGDQIDAGSYDTLKGLGGNDTLKGLGGSDTLDGGADDDKLYGGDGNDKLQGGDGNDLLDGGRGVDSMRGGKGNDAYVVDNALDTVTELAGEGADTVRSGVSFALPANVENLTLAGTANLNGTGNGSGNILAGNVGNNTLDGGAGSDWADYAGAPAGVTVSLQVAAAQNTKGAGLDKLVSIENVLGGRFADTLAGNAAANALKGGDGNDKLAGGGGRDTLHGGAGADTFVYTSASDSGLGAANRDSIAGFSRPQHDKLDVHLLDAQPALPGVQAWGFVAGFSGAAGQVKFDAASHLVLFDQNGDKAADFSIELAGVPALAASDFIFA